MAGTHDEFADQVDSDRDITPLSEGANRIPSIIFLIAIVVGIALLLVLQLTNGNRGNQAEELRTFNLPTTPIELTPAPQPIQTPEPIESGPVPDSRDNRFELFELERLRQVSLLKEQKAELERKRLAAEEAETIRRRQSEMLIVDNGGITIGSEDGGFLDLPDEEFIGSSGLQSEVFSDPNERFLRDASEVEVVKASAVEIENQDFVVTQGTIVSGVLETAINSDLPGLLRAVVDKNVYSRTGRNLVIPKGSRLIGRYRSGIATGQARIYIIWSRLERPDGVIVNIGSPGIDQIGLAGLGGDVDKHFFEKFGAATVLSAIGPIVSLIADDGASEQETQIINDGSDNFESIAGIALENSINIPPTITVDQGTEIAIFVNRDLSFANVPSNFTR